MVLAASLDANLLVARHVAVHGLPLSAAGERRGWGGGDGIEDGVDLGRDLGRKAIEELDGAWMVALRPSTSRSWLTLPVAG